MKATRTPTARCLSRRGLLTAVLGAAVLPIVAAGAACAGRATPNPDGILRGDTGRTYRTLIGTLRNDGTGWAQVDGAHSSTGIDSVSTSVGAITVNFASLGAISVGTFQVTPDESLALAGYMFGASVGLTQAIIRGSSRSGAPVDFTKLTTALIPESNLWLWAVFQC